MTPFLSVINDVLYFNKKEHLNFLLAGTYLTRKQRRTIDANQIKCSIMQALFYLIFLSITLKTRSLELVICILQKTQTCVYVFLLYDEVNTSICSWDITANDFQEFLLAKYTLNSIFEKKRIFSRLET